MAVAISSAEKDYVKDGCEIGLRFDGRGPSNFRSVSIENNVFPHVNGSSRVRVADSIDILCAVKVEVGEPKSDAPNEGVIEVFLDISPSCAPKVDDRRLADQGALIAKQLESFFLGSSAIDLKTLCIIPGRYCWVINIDLLVLEYDGLLIDACSVAAYVALNCTVIPKIELFVGESGTVEDFEVSGDIAEAKRLPAESIPLCVSTAKIGSSLILDAAACEIACASAVISVAVNKGGGCCGIVKSLGGKLSKVDIAAALVNATMASSSVYSTIEDFLAREDRTHPDAPYNRWGLLI